MGARQTRELKPRPAIRGGKTCTAGLARYAESQGLRLRGCGAVVTRQPHGPSLPLPSSSCLPPFDALLMLSKTLVSTFLVEIA